jgi:hypothetical protein
MKKGNLGGLSSPKYSPISWTYPRPIHSAIFFEKPAIFKARDKRKNDNLDLTDLASGMLVIYNEYQSSGKY